MPDRTESPRSTHALEWGSGSVLLGLLLITATPLGAAAASLGFYLYGQGGGVWSDDIVRGIFDVILAVNVLLMLVAAVALWFGVWGVRWAGSTRTPAGIPAAGVVLNGVVLLILIVAAVTIVITRAKTLDKISGGDLSPARAPRAT